MAQCIVIADDLTGGNAAGVLLSKNGYRVSTLLKTEEPVPSMIRDADCIVCPTNSRGVGPEEAGQRVRRACEMLIDDQVKLCSLRIDSTLRGNPGAETDAMLDFLGNETIALATPAFPASGRVVCGGHLLVDGVPLLRTAIATDPKSPARTSEVAAVFRAQSRYRVASVNIDELARGADDLAERMRHLAASGHRIITFDCVDREDPDLIAEAAIMSGLKLLAVDPGVLTEALMRRMVPRRPALETPRILSVVGSVHPLAREQMRTLLETETTRCVMVCTRLLVESKATREREISRVAGIILAFCRENRILSVTGDGIIPENRIDFSSLKEKTGCGMEEACARINSALAEIAFRVFRAEPSFRGLYTCGGDVTAAVCERFGTTGLSLEEEVLPLAAYGRFLSGDFQGIHMISKGGSQGDKTSLVRCLSFLEKKLGE